jgi:hypothetical protein
MYQITCPFHFFVIDHLNAKNILLGLVFTGRQKIASVNPIFLNAGASWPKVRNLINIGSYFLHVVFQLTH